MDKTNRNKLIGSLSAIGVLVCGVGLIFTNGGDYMFMLKNFVLWFLTYYFGWKLAVCFSREYDPKEGWENDN